MRFNESMPGTVRVKQRLRVRGDIDAAALHLFSEHGFDDVTTEQIAAAAGVSPSTYFRHVSSKEDLLLRPLRASSAAVAGLFAEDTDPDIRAGLIGAVRNQSTRTDPELLARWRSVIRSVPRVLDKVALITEDDREAIIATAAERLGVDADDDWSPGTTVCGVLAVVEYGYRRWMRSADDQRSLLACIDDALDAAGLLTV